MKLGLLVKTSGKQEGKVLEIKLPQFLVGRDPQCQLRPASPLISKRHCAILQRDGKAFIRDFGSTNGTFVNDEPVEGERELHHDDTLKIGPIEFLVRLEKTPAATKTPVPPTKGIVKSGTPVPPTKKPADSTPIPATRSDSPDDLAAMLLSMDDGDEPTGGPLSSDGVPEGSTVMDLRLPPEMMQDGEKPADKEKDKAKASSSGDTRAAASRILDMMTKRPRT